MGSFNNNIATAVVRLDTRVRLKKSGKFATKLEIYYSGKKKRYTTPVQCTEAEWKKINASHLKDNNLRESKNIISEILCKANDIISTLQKDFSFERFELLYLGNKAKAVKDRQNVYDAFRTRISMLHEEQRIGTARSYTTTMHSLMKYKAKLCFNDITVEFLRGYERYMLHSNKSLTTIGIHLRTLRAIVNEAIVNKIIPADMYPFGLERKKKYEIPTSRNIKKALDIKSLRAIIDYEPTSENEAKAKDFWLFSFYCNGLNMKDIFKLKYCDIQGDFLYVNRQKTMRTKKEAEQIEIYITKPIAAIINRWGNSDKSPTEYVFDIYKKDADTEQNYDLGNLFIHVINRHMVNIGKKLNLNIKLTTYVARHSWATLLMREGVPVSYISKGLGHSSLATTERYFGSFMQNQKIEAAELLLETLK